jgi:beta-glucosidase
MDGDSYQLYVDNKLLIEQPNIEGQSPQAKDLDLPAGKPVAVRFEFISHSSSIRAGLGVIPAAGMVEPEALKMAAKADVVLVAVGFNPRSEGEGHDRTYSLPAGQDELIKAVCAANKNTIVTITAGGSVETSGWIDNVPAMLQTWYGGQEGGRALAKVLLGEVNPSGKLPITWERRLEDNPTYGNYYEAPGSKDVTYKEGIFVGYRGYEHLKVKPLFPFGFGLSYTTFSFANLSVAPAVASAGAPITVSFDVSNQGKVAGAEVAQVYVGDPSATIPRPVKELKAFERVVLKPGETRHVSVQLDRRSLAYFNIQSKGWKVDPGRFKLFVGDSSASVPLQKEFTVQ